MNINSVLLILVSLIALGSLIYTLVIKNREDEVYEDKIWVINSMTQYTKDKRALGKFKRQIERNGWVAVEFYPRDVNFKKLEREGKQLEPEVIFVPKENLEWKAKGEWSGDCGFVIIHPIGIEDMPDGLKNSNMGLGFSVGCTKAERSRVESNIMRIKDNSINRLQEESVKHLDVVRDAVDLEKEKRKEFERPREKEEK